MTDPGMADATYIEPLNVERLAQIIEKERPDALLPNLGGQNGLNLSLELARAGILDKFNVMVIGVKLDAIERGEDRIIFKETMNSLGIEVPKSTADLYGGGRRKGSPGSRLPGGRPASLHQWGEQEAVWSITPKS